MNRVKISIIGAGHMGLALAKGFLKVKAFSKEQIILANPSKPDEDLGIKWVTDNNIAANFADYIFIAVKPGKVEEVLENLVFQSRQKLLISLAAGISIKKLQKLVKGQNLKVIRIMPNLAIQSGVGVIGVYKDVIPAKAGIQFTNQSSRIPDQVGNDNLFQELKEKLSFLGQAVEVDNEKELDVLTIISGCSPALIAYFARSFTEFSGTPERLVLKSLIGSLKYLEESELTFEEVIKAVATKGGITENILKYLEKKKVKENISQGLQSGYKKLEGMDKND